MEDLNAKQKQFCEEYIVDWNATRAYQKVYGGELESSRRSASRLLTNVDIQAYIKDVQRDLSKLSGVTALRNIKELAKLAYTNISDFKNDWGELKDWDDIAEDKKAALCDIQEEETNNIKKVKIKLHDKIKAIETLNRMLGLNEPEQQEIKGDFSIPAFKWAKKE